MSRTTDSGAEASGVWSTAWESMWALIRSAMKRCVAGEIMRSSSASMYHDGFSVQPGLVIDSPRHFKAIGFWVAVIKAISSEVASGATALANPSADIQEGRLHR